MGRYADLAQLVEQLIRNEQVVGSSPIISSIWNAEASERSEAFFVWVATQLRERSERNKNPPAMRVEDKKLYKKHLSRLY